MYYKMYDMYYKINAESKKMYDIKINIVKFNLKKKELNIFRYN